jgi:hypothetical protein
MLTRPPSLAACAPAHRIAACAAAPARPRAALHAATAATARRGRDAPQRRGTPRRRRKLRVPEERPLPLGDLDYDGSEEREALEQLLPLLGPEGIGAWPPAPACLAVAGTARHAGGALGA